MAPAFAAFLEDGWTRGPTAPWGDAASTGYDINRDHGGHPLRGGAARFVVSSGTGFNIDFLDLGNSI
jgi:hypothetical protein